MTLLNDSINVTCCFEKGKLIPLSFEWKQRRYPILRTVFKFKTQQGSEPIHVFSCETANGVFDLSFNLQTLSWRIRAFHQES